MKKIQFHIPSRICSTGDNSEQLSTKKQDYRWCTDLQRSRKSLRRPWGAR